jgi:hypothetical protein
MIVGIDGSAWTHPGGFGRYTRELTPAPLRQRTHHTFLVFLDEAAGADGVPAGARVARVRFGAAADPGVGGRSVRTWRDLLTLRRALGGSGIDAAYFPSLLTYVPLPLPTIVGIHDAIGHRYPRSAFMTRRSALAWRMKSALAVSRAARIITVSAHARASPRPCESTPAVCASWGRRRRTRSA